MNTLTIEKLRVLILEDSSHDYELICEQLTTSGFLLDVERAITEVDFAEKIQKACFDLIISDFKLPGFDAFTALNLSKEICPDTPFICLSGSIGEITAIELLKQGAVDYVLKDRPDRLPFAIKRALDDSKERKKLKAAQKALQESEARFKQVVEVANEWIWETDNEGIYTYCSPACESITGYKPEELVGKMHFYDLFPPNHQADLMQNSPEFLKKIEVFRDSVNENLHKDGHIVLISTTGIPIINSKGKLTGYRGVAYDITLRKQAEEVIQNRVEELERFHKLTIGRELFMIELKKEINHLLGKLGKEPKYKIVE